MKRQMNRIAIVILNYLNYMDTIECVDSIIANKYELCGIVIVDNGSQNDSYKRLKERYSTNQKIFLLKLKQNCGFAKGNNVGIAYARKKIKADYVYVVNNDTLFTEPDFFTKMLDGYAEDVGVIGSKIFLKDGKVQDEIKEYLGLRDSFFAFVNAWSLSRGSSFDFPIKQGKSEPILHGCALLFTPTFFMHYKGFYPHTFLYGEEIILALMCKCKNIRQVYVTSASIYHKEDQSSIMSFRNDSSIKKKYSGQSRKYILLWSIKYRLIRLMKRCIKVEN